ncbi:MAG: hypothetical protein NTW86_30380, partial [Candidatus Sumerlaeota bacterium]|nr:hypothetical protein [Candidatus Sumerlaeota bacterium]
GLTVAEIAGELERRDVEAQNVRAASALLERCDQARFAPGAQEIEAMRGALAEAERLIAELARKM